MILHREIVEEPFARKMSPYDLLNNNFFKRRRVNSILHGTELVSYLGPKIYITSKLNIKNEKENIFID